MTTTSRLLSLLSLLQTRRDWPGSLLAARLEISDRTVRRDIDRLRELGYAIHATMGTDGGYRLDAGSELPPLLFDDDQVVAMAIALQAAPGMGAGIEEAAIRALGTIRQVMPSRLRHRLDALQITTIGRPGDASLLRVSLDVLVTLANAIQNKETVRFDYAGRTADGADDGTPRPPRHVEPHHLVTSQGGGTSSGGTSTVMTGASTAPTVSAPGHPEGPVSPPAPFPVAMSANSSPHASRGRTSTNGPAAAP